MTRLPITVIMLTLNEERNLPGALDNVMSWAEEVFVVDSLSVDRTVDIALERGARVVQRAFTNFSDQWNWALDHLPVKTPWTLKMDPDERASDTLVRAFERIVTSVAPLDAYYVAIRLWFMGRPLHKSISLLRLWQTGRCRFSDVLVNEHMVAEGETGRIDACLEHHDSPDLHHWFEKQNRYSTLEAIMRHRGDALAATPRFFGNALERRMFFKKAFWRLPFRYALLYLYHLIACGAWRDGSEGRAWARLRTEVYRAIELKTREIATTGREPVLSRPLTGDRHPEVHNSELQKRVDATGTATETSDE